MLELSENQTKWVAMQKALHLQKQFFPQLNLHGISATRRHLFQLASSSRFDSFITTCIILNTVAMMLQISPTPSVDYENALDTANSIFALVFNVEMILKLSAMHFNYFRERWNQFDFACVMATDAGMMVKALSTNPNLENVSTVTQAVRIFRIARLFRLVRYLKGLNQLFNALLLSIPKLANEAVILTLLLYLYCVTGVELFAVVKSNGLAHDSKANFRSFFHAFMTLVRSMTGEAWNEIMHDLSRDKYYFESLR